MNQVESLTDCKHFLHFALHQNENLCQSGFFYELFTYFGLIGSFFSSVLMFVISLRLNVYLRQKVMHETLPDNKINKISKVNEREEKGSAPTKKKDIPKDTSMIDLDIGNTSLDNSKEKKKE
jgi:hypothetical protein